MKQEVILCCFI